MGNVETLTFVDRLYYPVISLIWSLRLSQFRLITAFLYLTQLILLQSTFPDKKSSVGKKA